MSIRIMSRVWDHYPGKGSDLLAMLALADWSDDDGRCYPSIAALAKKIRLKERQTQNAVRELIEQGFVSVTGNEAGGAPGMTRRYRVAIERLTGAVECTQTVNEPSIAISPRARKKSKAPLPLVDWLAQVAAAGEKAIPDDDPVRGYCAKAGIPADYLRLCWFEFRDRYTQPDAKTYTDWRAVFRNAVRGNWLKLWFFDQGQCQLTTAGKQALHHLENDE
jgi:Helix-turn-helix domain